MANPYKQEAREANDAKLRRMGVQVRTADEYDDRGEGHAGPARDGSQGVADTRYATGFSDNGGKQSKSHIWKNDARSDDGARARPRADRKAFANGGRVGKKAGTTVNVIVAGGPKPAMPPIPVPAGNAAPPPIAAPGPMPGAGPMGAPPQSGMAVPRKRGGRVGYAKGGLVIGSRVEGGKRGTEDYDTGIIHGIKGNVADIGWDSGSRSPTPLDLVRPIGRQRGGRIGSPKMRAGAGSGEGRREKVDAYGKKAFNTTVTK